MVAEKFGEDEKRPRREKRTNEEIMQSNRRERSRKNMSKVLKKPKRNVPKNTRECRRNRRVLKRVEIEERHQKVAETRKRFKTKDGENKAEFYKKITKSHRITFSNYCTTTETPYSTSGHLIFPL